MRATTTGSFIRKTSGMPGKSHVFPKRMVGHVTSVADLERGPFGDERHPQVPVGAVRSP